MDEQTRRMDRSREPSRNSSDAAVTRRLDRSELPPERGSAANSPQKPDVQVAALHCLRCGTLMVETQAWGGYGDSVTGKVKLTMRGVDPLFHHGFEVMSCNSMTCPRCGYTELYASDLRQLSRMFNNNRYAIEHSQLKTVHEVEEERIQREREASIERLNRQYAEEQKRKSRR